MLYFSGIAAAFDTTKIQWDTGKSGTLKRNEVMTFNEYSVQVTGFNAPVESDKYKQMPIDPVEGFVELNISRNGSFMAKASLGQGESYISTDGEVKVTAVELPLPVSKDWLYESYNPWAKIEINPPGKPKMEILMDSDDEFVSAPSTEIVVKITLKNTGSADLNQVNMDIVSELPVLRGTLKYYYETLKRGAEVTETVTFSTPAVNELKKYDISVNTGGSDIKGDIYKSVKLKTILIAPQPQQAPILRKTTISKMYLKDQMLITLYLKNNANYELNNVSIVDTIPKGFKLLTNNSLKWKVNVPANGEWYIRYLLKPTESNSKGVLFPSATAEMKISNEYYMIQSNRPETVIYGPKIELVKQSNVPEIDPGDTVTVTVVATNTGTTPTTVTIQDTLPSEATFVSGTTNIEEYLEANKEIKLSYIIKSNSNKPIRLPRATAEYYELGSTGSTINITSPELLIRIKPPPTPVPTPAPIVETTVNSTGKSNTSNAVEKVTNNTKKPEESVISKPLPEPLFADSNAVMNLLLDCSQNNGNDSRTFVVSEVCSSVANNS